MPQDQQILLFLLRSGVQFEKDFLIQLAQLVSEGHLVVVNSMTGDVLVK